MANHPFAGKTAIWDNLRSSDKRNYYHKSLLNISRDLLSKSSPVFFHQRENHEISSWSAEDFLLNRQRRFARGQKDELPLGQNYAFLVLEFLSPSMVVIGIIVITQKIQCMLSISSHSCIRPSSPFMLRNSARLQLSVLKFSCRASFHHRPHKHTLHHRPCHGNDENQHHKGLLQ